MKSNKKMAIGKKLNPAAKVSAFFVGPICLALIFILVMFAILFSQYQQSLVKTLEDQTSFFINHVDASTFFADEILIDISNQVFYDSTIKKLRENTNLTNMEVIEGIRKLNSITATTSIVDSIYVYNEKTGYIYSTLQYGAVSDTSDQFKDTEAVDIFRRRSIETRLTLIPRKTYTTAGYIDADLYSFLYYEISATDAVSDNAILLNLKSSNFAKLYFAGSANDTSFIIDSSGTIIYENPGNSEILKDENLKRAIISNILADTVKKSGHVEQKGKADDYVCFYSSLEIKDWIFVKIIGKNEIMGKMLTTKRITSITLGVFIILFIFLFIFATRRVYIPFIRVSKKVSEINDLDDNEKGNTSELIQKRIDTIIDERKTTRSMSEKLKESLLRDILTGEIAYDSPELFLDECRLRIAFACPVILYLISSSDIVSLLSVVQGVVTYSECVSFGSDFTLFLLQPTAERDFDDLKSNLQTSFPETYNIYSDEINDWGLLPNMFAHIKERWLLRFLTPNIRVIDISKEEERNHSISDLTEKTAGIISHLKKGQKSKALEEYQEYVKMLEKKKYPIVRRSLLNFSGAVVKLKGEGTKPNENENTTFMTLLESNPSSMEEITSFFIENIQTIAQQQKDKLNNRQETNSQAIADYIDANFRNPQLSTKHLSTEFNLSEAYLARIFKKALGISVQGYINKVRVEEAKRVLADPKMKIKDLTEMIGIQNRQYFFKLFKNLTGKTPNEYQVDLEILRSEPHK